MGEEQLSRTQGLAKHVEKHREWKLPHVSESEGLAVLGSHSVAQGALHGVLAGLGGGHRVEAWEENVRGDLQGEGPALEQGQVWDGGGADGQLPLGQVLDAVKWVLIVAVQCKRLLSRGCLWCRWTT